MMTRLKIILVAALFSSAALAQGVAPTADLLTVKGRTLAARANDTFNIADYGAKCDGSTNDNAAINAALTAAYNSTAYQNSDAVKITGPAGAVQTGCVMNSANLTQFNLGAGSNPRPRVELSGMTWLCTGRGNACLDALGATFVAAHDFSIRGDNVAPPEICVQVGITGIVASSAWHNFERVNCAGYFTFTALYNVGSENNTYIGDVFGNIYASSGPIWSLGTISGGSGYVNGAYSNVPLTGGSCATGATIASCATANITVSGGAVTAVTLAYQGRDYVAGDVLSAAASSLGGTGSGFSVLVATLRNYSTVIDGANHWRSASAFVASTLPTDTYASTTLLNFVGVNMRGATGGLWISGAGRPTFTNSFLYTPGPSCVDLYDSGVSKWGYDFGLNMEGCTTNAFFVTGPNSAPQYTGFRWRGYANASTLAATFGVDSNIASVTLNNADILKDYLATGVMFANAPIWTVSGRIGVNAATQFNAPSAASQVQLTVGGNQTPPGVGPLDIMSNAAIAVSAARQISRSYAGPLLRVQRASDSATMDIYADAAGNLDKGAYQGFCSASTCGVTTLYDQTGNGNNCTQTTAASQPALNLVQSSLNNRASMTWATATAMSCGAGTGIADMFASGGYALTAVWQNANALVNRLAFKAGATGGWEWRAPALSTSPYMSFNVPASTSAGAWTYLTAIPVGGHVYDLAYNASSDANAPTLAIDGAQLALSATQPAGAITTDAAVPLYLGNNALTGGTRGFIGSISEFIVWKATPTSAQIEALRRNLGNFYGVAAQ